MSIVHVDKILVRIAKKFEMRTSGGGVVNDFGHPRTRGGGGSKKGKFLRTSFMDGPLGFGDGFVGFQPTIIAIASRAPHLLILEVDVRRPSRDGLGLWLSSASGHLLRSGAGMGLGFGLLSLHNPVAVARAARATGLCRLNKVLGYGFGVRVRKVKSHDCALASDLKFF